MRARYLPLLACLALGSRAQASQVAMGTLDVNGFHLVNAQYLPFVGDEPLQYPDDALFGFYPTGVTDPARDCAVQAYQQVSAFFQADSAMAQRMLALGGAVIFDLWINDYTQAGSDHAVLPAGLEHWPSDSDYKNGSWNWVSSVTQSGACELPTNDQVAAELAKVVQALSGGH